MNQNSKQISVLVGGQSEAARRLSGLLTENGITVYSVEKNPFTIQYNVFTKKPDAVVISNQTKSSISLCESLKKISDPPYILLVDCEMDCSHCPKITNHVDDEVTDKWNTSEIYEKIITGVGNPKKAITDLSQTAVPKNCEGELYTDVDLHYEISELLSRLCVTPNYNGYGYIREAIKLAVKDENCMRGISKQIYPEVAKIMHVTASGVERSIRTAIHRSWDKVDDADKISIFGTYSLQKDWVPTNSEYIFVLADRLSCKIKASKNS